MNVDKCADLLAEMTEDLQHMPEISAHLPQMIRDAVRDWNSLSDPQSFTNKLSPERITLPGDLSPERITLPGDLVAVAEFEARLDLVSIRTREIKEELRDLDWLLANVIRLRGKLAEELGVPMMSHLKGPAGFGRSSAEFKM